MKMHLTVLLNLSLLVSCGTSESSNVNAADAKQNLAGKNYRYNRYCIQDLKISKLRTCCRSKM